MVGSLFYSFVIAQVFGLYMIIYSIIVLSRADYYRALINSIELPSLAIHNGATIMLLIGIFLVDIHNVWVLKPNVVITLLSWIILLKSILWLSIPEAMLSFSKKMISGKAFYVVVLLVAVVGFIMLTRGFYLYMNIEHLNMPLNQG